MDISKYISTKHKLKFRKDGKFKLVVMSDIHQGPGQGNTVTFNRIKAVLDAEMPDLVILCGDTCDSSEVTTEAELREYIPLVAEIFAERKIPWAQVWGNHEHDLHVDKALHQELYMAQPYNVSGNEPDITGYSNFVLPILSSKSDEVAFNIWGLDCGPRIWEHRKAGFDLEMFENAMGIENKVHPFQNTHGLVCFDQIMWYYETSMAFEAHFRKKIPGLLATHVAPYEITAVTMNREQCNTVGDADEDFSLNILNGGLFAAVIQRGDIKVICSGHTHDNNECGTYCGVMLCNDGSIGGDSLFGDARSKGVRIFELDENNLSNISTRFTSIKEYGLQ